jgi:hypothetical protein
VRATRLLLAAAVVLAAGARAEVDEAAIVRRAELAGSELRLCVERGADYETLSVDVEDPDAPLRSEPGCAGFGEGVRLPVRGSDDAREAVHIDGNAAVYVDREGNVIRIPLDLEAEPAPSEPAAVPEARRSGGIQRVPTSRGSSRVVLPGPRAGEIGDATRDATLGGLEQTLDPVTEPTLALGLRSVSAAVGFVVGAALYIPTTLLDVLETEYGDVDGAAVAPDEPDECDPYDRPYDPYDPYDRGGRPHPCH